MRFLNLIFLANIEQQIEEERKAAEEVKSELREWQKKNKEQNKKMGGVHMSSQHHKQTVKNVRKLDNQLELVRNSPNACFFYSQSSCMFYTHKKKPTLYCFSRVMSGKFLGLTYKISCSYVTRRI